MINADNIFNVSQLNQHVSQLLSQQIGTIWLEAEIGQLTRAASGHWYLTLKDSSSQVRCAMFRMRNRQLSWQPNVGDAVLVKAQVGLYAPRGEYQLVIDAMQPAGVGRLQQAFEQLKNNLQQRGWFDHERKRPLPETIRRVGVVTSSSGAAVHDILTVMARRDASVDVVIYPSAVQGEGAAEQIAVQIALANRRREVDVLIVGRGGGSLEDLWCFNTEVVAAAMLNSRLPVISAVGHEVDVSIADLVADMRAATPSAAAEVVTRDAQHRVQAFNNMVSRLNHAWQHQAQRHQLQLSQLNQRLERHHPHLQIQQHSQRSDEMYFRLKQAMARSLSLKERQHERLQQRLSEQRPSMMLARHQSRLDGLQQRLTGAIKQQLQQRESRLALQAGKLDIVSPLATLSRGYSITRTPEQQVIRSIAQVEVGQTVVTLLEDGQLESKLTAIKDS
ncbi:exodeoxyribonuclease VII large subunit [Neiella marina]|uniref:Exodeoxyribonuclease 7 large subunit n=1 Tax=Neiella holothuriorum TaxID=2870530 RepID=A0ABS7EEW4_9GAMM|nr:exodeoxyribonuclease VII large subunit [Neiella holothuriorum]MBW8190858.1 exodeoxyribonuclease VII large subunit [Neiella holothuriorum]